MTSSEEELGRVARQRIGNGELPGDPSAHQMWGSRGTGEPCGLCACSIDSDEIEYEVAVASLRGDHVLRFHIACYSIWRAECARIAAAAAARQMEPGAPA